MNLMLPTHLWTDRHTSGNDYCQNQTLKPADTQRKGPTKTTMVIGHLTCLPAAVKEDGEQLQTLTIVLLFVLRVFHGFTVIYMIISFLLSSQF